MDRIIKIGQEDCAGCKYELDGCDDYRKNLLDSGDCFVDAKDQIKDGESHSFMIVFRFHEPGEHVVFAKLDNTTGEKTIRSAPIGDRDPGEVLIELIDSVDGKNAVVKEQWDNGGTCSICKLTVDELKELYGTPVTLVLMKLPNSFNGMVCNTCNRDFRDDDGKWITDIVDVSRASTESDD